MAENCNFNHFTDYCEEAIYGAILGGSENEDELLQEDSPLIGTLSEKSVHKFFKNYYEPNIAFHEKKVGSFVADIYDGFKIIEIQTGSFISMKEKLKYYIEKNIPVKIVHPIACQTTLFWVDKDTGEVISTRKSPKKQGFDSCLRQMASLREFLNNNLISFDIVLCEMDEYKTKIKPNRKNRKGTQKVDREVEKVVSTLSLINKEDYLYFLPERIVADSEFFCAKDICSEDNKINSNNARLICYVLQYANTISLVDDKIREDLGLRKGTKVYKINR